jgi:peptidyl-prolyl cis-trans isomerase SurA
MDYFSGEGGFKSRLSTGLVVEKPARFPQSARLSTANAKFGRVMLVAWLGLVVLWGARPVSAQFVDGIAAIVNDKVITFSEVKKQVDPTEKLLRESYAGPELVDKVKEARLNALKALIERQLIIQDFNKAGYFVPENIVDDRVKEVINSQFEGDRPAFVKTLLANGISLDNYRHDTRDQIIVQYMRQKNVTTAVIVSPYRIEQYYQENLKQFVQEEQVHLHIIFLRKTLFKPTRPKPDGTMEEYDPQQEILKEIIYKLDTGSSFDELARSYSEGPKRETGGDLGWVTSDTLRPELRDIAFSLKPGQHSTVIPTDDGFYMLRVEDVKRSRVQPISEAHDQIEKTLLLEERQKLQQDWIDGLRTKAYIKMF